MSWQDFAACVGRTDIDWFPQGIRGGQDSAWRANIAAAREVCDSCPVRAACLADALANWNTAGIWAGTTETERDKMPRPRRPVVRGRAQCGTDSGYANHLRWSKTTPCDACKAAHALASRQRDYRRRVEVSA